MALDDHEEIVEVVGDAAGETADGFHFLSLAELFFELMTLGNVLGDDEADPAAAISKFVGDDLDVHFLAVFSAVLPDADVAALHGGLPEMQAEAFGFFRSDDIEGTELFEFLGGVAV